MTTRIALIGLFGALLLTPALGLAEDGAQSLERIAIEHTQTPEEHAELARHYRSSAQDARAMVHRHQAMAKSYSQGKFVQRQQMRLHCKSISDKYEGIAKDFDALAEYHEEAAKAKH